MSGEGEGKAVCVTGASGYIASWLVKCLLLRGYTVKATVRDPNDSKKTEHLLALDGAKERLHLLKANLLEKGSFDSVVEECIGVFHTASPLNFSAVNPQTDMVDPAVKGTLNVLESCTKVPSIKRVVLTSSIASVIFNGKPLTPDTLVDETWFSDAGYCEKIKNWYFVSKTLAEDAAIRFAETNGIDLVVLNPGVVIGPLLQPTLNFSVEVILNLVNGIPVPIHYPLVDVRDIAYAHIYAFEVPTANGRNLLVNQVIRSCEILEILHQNYPTLDLPQKYKNEEEEVIYQVSKEKAKSLGIEFMSLEVSLRDTIESLKEKEFLKL